ncbi:uncharacterized protein LOC111400921 [Olea europaea var. sylvestris]|uniref:Uncharacterized protein n=1 Tax=Olea europaea subsp. europaea TaxID=158383 RepID=A0A8S0SCT2_OLEEU|nr:uncharacterized protein LOC111400921 [Olea europaea var. sylvestris]CAA2990150.1 Hypothetical predicted protein [Olea europaea subsp. europaea]
MESEYVSGSNDVNKNSKVKHEDGKPLLEANASGFSSSVSSSSSSSLELNTGERDHLDYSAKMGEDGTLSSEPEPLSSPDVSGQTPNWSMISASPRAEAGFLSSPGTSYQTPEWNTNGTFQMQSPPVQTMGRPAGYDPNRIPSSIFSPKPTSAMEWSVTSNESLFSIHMGNNSFSRDQAILLGKSGEVPRTEEWNNSPSNLQYFPEARSNELNSFPSVLPPVIEVPGHDENSLKLGKASSVIKEDHSNSLKMATVEMVENHEKENIAPVEEIHPPVTATNAGDGKGTPPSEATLTSSGVPLTLPSLPRLSNESGNSGHSFAFPVFVNDREKTDSPRVVSAKPQLESQVSEANPKASGTRWFSSFLCWPRCC